MPPAQSAAWHYEVAATATTHTLTYSTTTGSAAAVTVGQLLVAFVELGSTGSTSVTVTAANGSAEAWTAVPGADEDVPSQLRTLAFYKVATANDTSMIVSLGGSRVANVQVVQFSGVNTGVGPDAIVGVNAGVTASPTVTSGSLSGPRLVVGALANQGSPTVTAVPSSWSTPSGWDYSTGGWTSSFGTGNNKISLHSFHQTTSAAGPVTLNGTLSAAKQWAGVLVAFTPTDAGGGGTGTVDLATLLDGSFSTTGAITDATHDYAYTEQRALTQVVTKTGTQTSSHYATALRLGAKSAPIFITDTAAQIQAKLQAMSGTGANVTVALGSGATWFTVTFTGTLAHGNQQPFQFDTGNWSNPTDLGTTVNYLAITVGFDMTVKSLTVTGADTIFGPSTNGLTAQTVTTAQKACIRFQTGVNVTTELRLVDPSSIQEVSDADGGVRGVPRYGVQWEGPDDFNQFTNTPIAGSSTAKAHGFVQKVTMLKCEDHAMRFSGGYQLQIGGTGVAIGVGGIIECGNSLGLPGIKIAPIRLVSGWQNTLNGVILVSNVGSSSAIEVRSETAEANPSRNAGVTFNKCMMFGGLNQLSLSAAGYKAAWQATNPFDLSQVSNTSVLWGLATDPASMGMTSQQLADAQRELARDQAGQARFSTISRRSIGAVEADPDTTVVPSAWQPTPAWGWPTTAVFSTTKYVAPIAADGGTTAPGWSNATGTGSGNSKADPWTLYQAVQGWGAGYKIILAAGTYHCPLVSDGTSQGSTPPASDRPFYLSRGLSTALNPVWFQSEVPFGAKITWLSTTVNDDIMQVSSDYMIFDGLEIDGNNYTGQNGFHTFGTHHHIVVKGCRVHHCRSGGIAFETGDYRRIDGCEVWLNGAGGTGTVNGSGVSLNLSSVAYVSDGYAGFHDYIVNSAIAGNGDQDTPSSSRSDGNGIIVDNGGGGSRLATPPTLIANNVIYHNGNRGIHNLKCTGAVYVVHNTLHENGLDTVANTEATATSTTGPGEINNQGGDLVIGNNLVKAWDGTGAFGSIPYHDAQVGTSVTTVFSCYYYDFAGGKAPTMSSPAIHTLTSEGLRAPPAASTSATNGYVNAPSPAATAGSQSFWPSGVAPVTITLTGSLTNLPSSGTLLIDNNGSSASRSVVYATKSGQVLSGLSSASFPAGTGLVAAGTWTTETSLGNKITFRNCEARAWSTRSQQLSAGFVSGLDWDSTNKRIQAYVVDAAGADTPVYDASNGEHQQVRVQNATSGTFRLRFNSTTWSGPIAWNATPAAIQTALEALSTIGVGNVRCRQDLNANGVAISGATEVVFQGSLAGPVDPVLIQADSALLVGSTPTVTVTTLQAPSFAPYKGAAGTSSDPWATLDAFESHTLAIDSAQADTAYPPELWIVGNADYPQTLTLPVTTPTSDSTHHYVVRGFLWKHGTLLDMARPVIALDTNGRSWVDLIDLDIGHGYSVTGGSTNITLTNTSTSGRGPVNYFVSAAGSDSNAGTSSGSPLQHIAAVNALNLIPGDTISFRSGDSFTDATLLIDSSGNAAHPITVARYSGTGTTTIQNAAGAIALGPGASFITVDGLTLNGAAGAATVFGSAATGTGNTNITLSNLAVSNTTARGIHAMQLVDDSWSLQDILVSNTGGSGITMNGSNAVLKGTAATKFVVSNTGNNGSWSGSRDGIVLRSSNGIADGVEVTTWFDHGISTRGKGCKVMNCYVHDGTGDGVAFVGEDTQGGKTLYAFNRVVNAGSGRSNIVVASAASLEQFSLIANTIVCNSSTGTGVKASVAPLALKLVNNGVTGTFQYVWDLTAPMLTYEEHNNGIYPGSGSVLRYGGVDYTLTAYRAATGQGLTMQVGDPKLGSSPGFVLGAGSAWNEMGTVTATDNLVLYYYNGVAPTVNPPAPPGHNYTLPTGGAVITVNAVSTGTGAADDIVVASANTTAKDIVLTPGTYDRSVYLSPAAGHRYWSQIAGRAVLRVGIQGSNAAAVAGLAVRGIAFDVASTAKILGTGQAAGILHFYGVATGCVVEDCWLRGNQVCPVGILAYGGAQGLTVRRVEIQDLTDAGVRASDDSIVAPGGTGAVTANSTVITALEDIAVTSVYRRIPDVGSWARGSSLLKGEVGVLVGHKVASFKRIRVRDVVIGVKFQNAAKATTLTDLDADLCIGADRVTGNAIGYGVYLAQYAGNLGSLSSVAAGVELANFHVGREAGRVVTGIHSGPSGFIANEGASAYLNIHDGLTETRVTSYRREDSVTVTVSQRVGVFLDTGTKNPTVTNNTFYGAHAGIWDRSNPLAASSADWPTSSNGLSTLTQTFNTAPDQTLGLVAYDAAGSGGAVTTAAVFGPTSTVTTTGSLSAGTYKVKSDGNVYDSTATTLVNLAAKAITGNVTVQSDSLGTARTLSASKLANMKISGGGLTFVDLVFADSAANFEVADTPSGWAIDFQGCEGTLRHFRAINYVGSGVRFGKSSSGRFCGSNTPTWDTASPGLIVEHFTAHAATSATGSALSTPGARNCSIHFDPGTQSTPTGLSGPATSAAIVMDGAVKTDVHQVFITSARDDATDSPLASRSGTYTVLYGVLKLSGITKATFLNASGVRPEKPVYFKLANGTLPGSETAGNCTNNQIVSDMPVIQNALAQNHVLATMRDGATASLEFEVTPTVYDPGDPLALWTPADVADTWPNGIRRFIHVSGVHGAFSVRPTVAATMPPPTGGGVVNNSVIDSTWTHLGGVQPDGALLIENVVFGPTTMIDGGGPGQNRFQSNIKNGGVQIEVASGTALSTTTFTDVPVRAVGGATLTPADWNLNQTVDTSPSSVHWSDASVLTTAATGTNPTTVTLAAGQTWGNNDWVTVRRSDNVCEDRKVTRVGTAVGGRFTQYILQGTTGAATLYNGARIVKQKDQFGIYTGFADTSVTVEPGLSLRRQLSYVGIDTTTNTFLGCRVIPTPTTNPVLTISAEVTDGVTKLEVGKLVRIVDGVAESFHPHGLPTGDQVDITTPVLTGTNFTVTRVDDFNFRINGQAGLNWNVSGSGVYGTFSPKTMHYYGLTGGAASFTIAAGTTLDDTANVNMGQQTSNCKLQIAAGLHVRFNKVKFDNLSLQSAGSTAATWIELWDCEMPVSDVPGKFPYDNMSTLGAAGSYDSANQHVYKEMLYSDNSIAPGGGALWCMERLVATGIHGDFCQGSFDPASYDRHCHIEHGMDVGAPTVTGSNARNGVAWLSGSLDMPKVNQGVHGDVQQWYNGSCRSSYATVYLTNAHAIHFSRMSNNYDYWLGTLLVGGTPSHAAQANAVGGLARITTNPIHSMSDRDPYRIRSGPLAGSGWVKKISNSVVELYSNQALTTGVAYAGATIDVDFVRVIHVSIPGLYRCVYLTSHHQNAADRTRLNPVNSNGNVSMNMVVDGGLKSGHPSAAETFPTTLITNELTLVATMRYSIIQTLDGTDGTWKMVTPLSPADYDWTGTVWFNFGLNGAAVPGGAATPTLS